MPSLKPFFTRRNVTLLTLLIAAVVLLIATRPSQASEPDTPMDYFICTPQQVGAFSNRVHVRCLSSAPDGIAYFAVCSDTNSNYASRALSVFTTAKVTAKDLAIYYDPSDLSGANCGCNSADCRVIYGVEAMP